MNSQFPACLTPQAGSLSIVSRFTCPPPPLLVPNSFAATTLVTRGVPRNGRPGCSARRQDGGLWSPVQQWLPGLCAPTVPLRDPSKPVVWGPGTCFLHLRRPHIMASPAKADSVLASGPAPDTLPVGPTEVANSGLGVQIPTGPSQRDSSVTPPSATCVAPVVLPDDPEDPDLDGSSRSRDWWQSNRKEVHQKHSITPPFFTLTNSAERVIQYWYDILVFIGTFDLQIEFRLSECLVPL